jgi:ferredoxin-type protein NapG
MKSRIQLQELGLRRSDMDRKGFFSHLFKLAVDTGIQAIEATPIGRSLEKLADDRSKVRPPGAVEEALFLQRCTGCDACMKACPVNVIMIEDLERRDPIIYPEKDPCIRCPGFPCIASCPTGALSRN